MPRMCWSFLRGGQGKIRGAQSVDRAESAELPNCWHARCLTVVYMIIKQLARGSHFLRRTGFVLIALFALLATARVGLSTTFSWNANTESNIAGYRLYYGTSSGKYTSSIDVGNTTSVTPSTLTNGQAYCAVVTAYNTSGLESLPSNEVAFTASATTTSTAGIWPANAVPKQVDGGSDGAVELGVKFRSDVAGTITGLRFYKASTNTGAHVANLWTSTGALLATANFTSETASGWQQVKFATPVAVSASTVYVASYHATAGHYSADVSYFSTVGVDNAPLHALSVTNGVYAYGANSVFPSQTWNATNYWVDVAFSPAAGTPPVISTTSLPAAKLNATYSATLTAAGGTAPYSWYISAGALPTGLTLNAATGAITGTPTATGTASFTAAVKDAANQVVTKALSIAVSTATAAGSLWPTTAVPTRVDGGADGAVELGIKFRSDVAGTITGVRFYKAATNTGAHVASLWSNSGTRLATASFASETASGWQQVSFTAPVAITANTVYVASYHCMAGHYSADASYFSTAGVDTAPLHALSVTNGVYAYGTNSLFPSQSWNATNYWVDVVFKAN